MIQFWSLADSFVDLHNGDCLAYLRAQPDNSFDSIVTDPPYALESVVKRFGKTSIEREPGQQGNEAKHAMQRIGRGFMGQTWDTGDIVHSVEFWAECLRVLKPGGFLASFAGTRTYHRMASAIDDAGFEVRDMLAWMFSTGFPKSMDASKAIDKAAGAAREVIVVAGSSGSKRNSMAGDFSGGEYYETAPATEEAKQFEGFGTALKPAFEPICLARKPLSEKTVALNLLKWGTGCLNIDGCRVASDDIVVTHGRSAASAVSKGTYADSSATITHQKPGQALGRFPANLLHDNSPEVLALFPVTGPSRGGVIKSSAKNPSVSKGREYAREAEYTSDNGGSAARFFYSPKANRHERQWGPHPTVKPIALMQWLVRLVTPKGGTLLDPFAGTGTTAHAAVLEGLNAIVCEREVKYAEIIERRMDWITDLDSQIGL